MVARFSRNVDPKEVRRAAEARAKKETNPLFTEVRGIGILRTSPFGHSRKLRSGE